MEPDVLVVEVVFEDGVFKPTTQVNIPPGTRIRLRLTVPPGGVTPPEPSQAAAPPTPPAEPDASTQPGNTDVDNPLVRPEGATPATPSSDQAAFVPEQPTAQRSEETGGEASPRLATMTTMAGGAGALTMQPPRPLAGLRLTLPTFGPAWLKRNFWPILSLLSVMLILWGIGQSVAMRPVEPVTQAGPLWDLARAMRESTRTWLPALTAGLPLLALILGAIWIALKRREGLAPAALLLAVALAFSAETLALQQQINTAALYFGVAAFVFALGLWLGRDSITAALQPISVSLGWEVVWLTAIVGVTFLLRFHQLGVVPYGVEGDESSWAYQVTEAMAITQGDKPYPFAQMPTTYWLQTLSFALWGLDLVAVRIGVAILSFLATILFYYAIREMVNIPVALIAAYLMAVSIVDVAGSRQAHVETYVKFFGVLTVFGLFMGYRRRNPLYFLLGGVGLALGLMVYDSFALVPLGIVAYMLFRLIRDRHEWRRHLLYLGAYLLPALFVLPNVIPYLNGRRFSQIAILRVETGIYPERLDQWLQIIPHLPAFILKFGRLAFERLTYQMLNDVLLNRPGPLESAAFIPFFFLGLVVAIWYWRHQDTAFPLFWVLIPALPTSLLLGQVFARTYLPYWGGFMLLAALALWVAVWSFSQAAPRLLRATPVIALVLFLGGLGLSNAYAYFNEVRDPNDRVYRRELGELLIQNIAPGEMLYWPYQPFLGDFLESEWRYPRFVARAMIPIKTDDQYYKSVPYPDLLATLSANRDRLQGIKVFYDKTINEPKGRDKILEAFKRCYPQHQVQAGKYFDVYRVDKPGLTSARCYSDVELKLTEPQLNQTVSAKTPPRLTWQASKGEQTSFQLLIDRHNDDVVWVEAEDLSRDNGWEPQAHLATDFTGKSYLADVRQDRPIVASGQADVLQAGTYTVWVRSYRRRDDGGPVTLTIGAQSFKVAEASTGPMNQWRWERVGTVDLPKGKLNLSIGRTFDGNFPWQIFIDTLVFSRQPAFDPNRQSDWEPKYDSQLVNSSSRQFTLPAALPPGDYRWRIRVFDGDRLLAGDGTPGIQSAYSAFRVTE